MTNNVVFGNRYLTAGKADLSSGGVLDSLPRAATTAELAPGNVVKLEKTCNAYVTIRLRNGSVRAASHRQLYSYLLDAQDSTFAQEYLDLLDAHIISEDLHGFDDFVVESHCCFPVHSLLDSS